MGEVMVMPPGMGPIHFLPPKCLPQRMKCGFNNNLYLHSKCIPGTEDDAYCACVCNRANCYNGGACKVVGVIQFCHCNANN